MVLLSLCEIKQKKDGLKFGLEDKKSTFAIALGNKGTKEAQMAELVDAQDLKSCFH